MSESVNGDSNLASTTNPFVSAGEVVPCDVAGLGKGFSLVLAKKRSFTHALAVELLEMKNVLWERPLRNRHVDALQVAMRQGTFLWELANLAFCVLDTTSEKYRVNGQHTSWSRLQVPELEEAPPMINVLHYSAASEADMRRLYASFDRGAARTKANTIASYLLGVGIFEKAPVRLVNLVAAGLPLWLWESPQECRRHSVEELALLIQTEHAEAIGKVVSYILGVETLPGWMHKAPVFAAMLSTFTKSKQASEEFWEGVRTGLGFSSVDDPRFRLREHLQRAAGRITTRADRQATNTDTESIYRCSVQSWNNWRAGKDCKVMRSTMERMKAK